MKKSKEKGDRKNITLVSLGTAYFIDVGESNVVNALFPSIRQAINLSVEHLGIIIAVKRIVALVFTPFWGIIADRYGRKNVLVWITGFWGLWTGVIGFVASYEQMLVLSIIVGIGLAALVSPMNSLISDIFPTEDRGKVFGILNAIAFIGTILSVLFFGFLAKNFEIGWRIAFWSLGGLSFLSGLLILLFVREPHPGQTEEATIASAPDSENDYSTDYAFRFRDLPSLFKTPTMILILIEYIPVGFWLNAFAGFSVTWLADERGFTPSSATFMLAFFLVGMAISSGAGGLIGDRARKISKKYGRVAVAQASLVMLSIVSFLLFSIQWTNKAVYPVLIFAFGLFGQFRYTAAIAPMISDVVLPEIRSTGFSLIQTMWGVMIAVASYLAGYFGNIHGLTKTFFWVCTVAAMVSAVLYTTFYRYYHRDYEKIQAILTERRPKG